MACQVDDYGASYGKKNVLRIGDLHVVMAMLRTIGAALEGSGLEEMLMEADIYGSATLRQILAGNHVSREVEAHTILAISLVFLCCKELAVEKPQLELEELLLQLCQSVDGIEEVMAAIEEHRLLNKMTELSNRKPMISFCFEYVSMVMDMLMYICSVRTGNWHLHLLTIQKFIPRFFTNNRTHYARIIPMYVADMKRLQLHNPAIWKNFSDGKWVVTKSIVPFTSLGMHHALEQVNRSLKVTGGIVGLTLNPLARLRFFLIQPELCRLYADAQHVLAGLEDGGSKLQIKHHRSSQIFFVAQHKRVQGVLSVLQKPDINPFVIKSKDLMTILTKKVVPEVVKRDVLQQTTRGVTAYHEFLTDRIKTGAKSIWATVPCIKLKLFKSQLKSITETIKDRDMELREDNGVITRMLLAVRCRPDIDT